jgi:hypothetical protein
MAPDGAASPVTPSGSSKNGGAPEKAGDEVPKAEKDLTEKIAESFTYSEFDKTQANRGGPGAKSTEPQNPQPKPYNKAQVMA